MSSNEDKYTPMSYLEHCLLLGRTVPTLPGTLKREYIEQWLLDHPSKDPEVLKAFSELLKEGLPDDEGNK